MDRQCFILIGSSILPFLLPFKVQRSSPGNSLVSVEFLHPSRCFIPLDESHNYEVTTKKLTVETFGHPYTGQNINFHRRHRPKSAPIWKLCILSKFDKLFHVIKQMIILKTASFLCRTYSLTFTKVKIIT